MKRFIFLFLTFISSPLLAESKNELLLFQVGGPNNQVEQRKSELRMPTNSKPPFKTIIIQHSSGPDTPLLTFNGRTDSVALKIGEQALALNYAVIYTDAFLPRNILVSHRVGSKEIGSFEIVRDIKFLIRSLQSDPRIDINNIYFFGHSLGGSVARDVSYPSTWNQARWLRGKATPFKAVAASAPGCHINREGSIGQPFKIFIGSDDDWTPPKPCLDFINEQKNNDVKFADIEIINGVGHTYSTRDTRWNSQAISFRGCMSSRVTVLGNGKFKQKDEIFDHQEYKKRCHTIGATSGGPGDKVDELARKVLEYFDNFNKAVN